MALTPRSMEEVNEAEHQMYDRVWYSRYQEEIAEAAEQGLCPACAGLGWGEQLARSAEQKYGADNLVVTDEFELGMLYGKFSALRWMLGEEWDTLDT